MKVDKGTSLSIIIVLLTMCHSYNQLKPDYVLILDHCQY